MREECCVPGGDATPGPKTGVEIPVAVRRFILITACLALVLSPLLYIGNYAGDSQVHLIYGQNAAEGRFFEFNFGEKSPGVTSPGYMLFLASLFRLFPDMWVAAIAKATNIISWYGLVVMVFLLARRLLHSSPWAWAAALTAGLLPGSVYNSTIGMENGIFAFTVFLWIYGATRTQWFAVPCGRRISLSSELLLGFLLGLTCWLRPEGFVVAAVALSYRAVRSVGSRGEFAATLRRSGVFLIPFLIAAGGLAYFHLDQTGHLVPTSGTSRILMSKLAADTFVMGPFFFSPKFSIRLAAYFPLTALWLFGNWLVMTRRGSALRANEVVLFLILLFWTAFILYSAIIGSVHLARYTIFAMPALVLVAMVGAKWLWDFWGVPEVPQRRFRLGMTFAVLSVALAAVFLIETNLRLQLDSQASLWRVMRAPTEQEAFSEELFSRLERPDDLPIQIALQEVQIRYWLDDRFVIRSLDGRVDPVLLEFATGDAIDHIGYLHERGVQFLLDAPNYNRDSDQWSLDRLRDLDLGETRSYGGLTFLRLPTGQPGSGTLKESTEVWPWFADADGTTVLNWFLNILVRVENSEIEERPPIR